MGKRGKPRRYTDKEREEAIQLYAVNANYEYVSEQLGIPQSTLKRWIKSDEAQPVVAELRRKNMQAFAAEAGEVVMMGAELLKRRMQTALDAQAEIDSLIDIVQDDEDMTDKQKMDVTRKLARLSLPDMREIATALGIAYDKRALARGEATQHVSQSVALRDVTDIEVQALLEKLRQDG